MSRRFIVIAVFGCALGFDLGLATIVRRAGRPAAAALARREAERAAWDAKIRFTAQELAAARADGAELRAVLAAAGAAPSPPPPASPPALSVADLLIADPELAALYARAVRTSVAAEYGPLYRRLGLDPGKIDRFEALMTEHQWEELDVLAGASTQGLDVKAGPVATLLLRENEELDTAQLAMLGADGYQQLQEFVRARPLRDLASQVGDAVALTSSPLTESQAARLSAILADASAAYRAGGRADPATIDWNRVLPEAAGLLSDAQFRALQGLRASADIDSLLAKFRREEDRASGPAPAPSANPP